MTENKIDFSSVWMTVAAVFFNIFLLTSWVREGKTGLIIAQSIVIGFAIGSMVMYIVLKSQKPLTNGK